MEPCIITIGGVEYDVTTFTKRHPGGVAVLRNLNGLDATQAFEDAGHSAKARAMLRGLVKQQDSSHNHHHVPTLTTDDGEEQSTSLFTDKDVFFSIKHFHKTFGFFTLVTYLLVLTGSIAPAPRTIPSLLP